MEVYESDEKISELSRELVLNNINVYRIVEHNKSLEQEFFLKLKQLWLYLKRSPRGFLYCELIQGHRWTLIWRRLRRRDSKLGNAVEGGIWI